MKWFPRLRPEEWSAVVGAVFSTLALGLEFFPSKISWVENSRDAVAVVGVAAFLGGIVVSLARLRKTIDEVQHLPQVIDAAIKFGGAVGVIAEAVRESERDIVGIMPHVRAGGQTLQHYALDILPGRAQELRAPNPGRSMRLVEYHYINDFLENLVACLPSGSTWLGVTHLTEGWLERSAEPGYRRFVELIHDRSRKGEVTVLRLYCARDAKELEPLEGHLANETKAGITVRTWIGTTPPPDLSLLWAPTRSNLRESLRETEEPQRILRENEATLCCGLEFATAAGRLIKQLEVYDQGSTHVSALQDAFGDAWSRAMKR